MEECAQIRLHVVGADHPSTLLSLTSWNMWKTALRRSNRTRHFGTHFSTWISMITPSACDVSHQNGDPSLVNDVISAPSPGVQSDEKLYIFQSLTAPKCNHANYHANHRIQGNKNDRD